MTSQDTAKLLFATGWKRLIAAGQGATGYTRWRPLCPGRNHVQKWSAPGPVIEELRGPCPIAVNQTLT